MRFIAPLIAGYHWLQLTVAAVADFDQVLKSQATVQTRVEVERMVMMSMAAELAGSSLVPADLTLRLMPHFVPHSYQWRRKAQNLVYPATILPSTRFVRKLLVLDPSTPLSLLLSPSPSCASSLLFLILSHLASK